MAVFGVNDRLVVEVRILKYLPFWLNFDILTAELSIHIMLVLFLLSQESTEGKHTV